MKKIISILVLIIISLNIFAFSLETNLLYCVLPKISLTQELPYNTYTRITYTEFPYIRFYAPSDIYFTPGIDGGFYYDLFKESPVYLHTYIGTGIYTDLSNLMRFTPIVNTGAAIMLKTDNIHIGINGSIGVIFPEWNTKNIFPVFDLGLTFKF